MHDMDADIDKCIDINREQQKQLIQRRPQDDIILEIAY